MALQDGKNKEFGPWYIIFPRYLQPRYLKTTTQNNAKILAPYLFDQFFDRSPFGTFTAVFVRLSHGDQFPGFNARPFPCGNAGLGLFDVVQLYCPLFYSENFEGIFAVVLGYPDRGSWNDAEFSVPGLCRHFDKFFHASYFLQLLFLSIGLERSGREWTPWTVAFKSFPVVYAAFHHRDLVPGTGGVHYGKSVCFFQYRHPVLFAFSV